MIVRYRCQVREYLQQAGESGKAFPIAFVIQDLEQPALPAYAAYDVIGNGRRASKIVKNNKIKQL